MRRLTMIIRETNLLQRHSQNLNRDKLQKYQQLMRQNGKISIYYR